jgi:hypothetical protein
MEYFTAILSLLGKYVLRVFQIDLFSDSYSRCA